MSTFAGQEINIPCPEPGKIVAIDTSKEKDEFRVNYCAPSSTDCQWKGFDSQDDKGSSANKLIDYFKNKKNGKVEIRGKSAMCDYKLNNGKQLRMSKKL